MRSSVVRRMLLGSLGVARAASAWDSACLTQRVQFDPGAGVPETLFVACPEGAGLAGLPWRSGSVDQRDEHRRLLDEALVRAGIPSRYGAVFELTSFSSAPGDIVPAPFSEVSAMTVQERTVSEFAQLPDYGYSLADWATGFETCPSDARASAEECHKFLGYLGALNSTHFLPQSETLYRGYHDLALTRAAACFELRQTLGGQAPRFEGFIDDCIREALIVEAVGQHYLQDSWSVGHMWQRWGAGELSQFPGSTREEQLTRAIFVALAAGLIHGSEAILGFDDAMCSPDDAVFYRIGETTVHAVGDLYARLMLDSEAADSPYFDQRARFLACSTAGLDAVYGAATGRSPTGLEVGPGCFAARATNQALLQGFGLDRLDFPVFTGFSVVIEPLLATALAPDVVNGFSDELVSLGAKLWEAANRDPSGTDMAEGGIGPLLGVDINSAYPLDLQSSYYAPDFALWTARAEAQASQTEPGAGDTSGVTAGARLDPLSALPRMFHRAHAGEWCSALTLDGLLALRERARGKPEADAAVQLCAEMAGRHLDVLGSSPLLSSDPTQCDGPAPPLPMFPGLAPDETRSPDLDSFCALVAPQSARIEYRVRNGERTAPTHEMALNWCRRPACDERFVDIQRVAVEPTTVPVGGSFDVSWQIAHSRLAGDTYLFGLYLAVPEELEGRSGLLQDEGVPRIFRMTDLLGDPGRLTCTRTDVGRVGCTAAGVALGVLDVPQGLSGEYSVTFRACVAFVFAPPTEETCEDRQLTMTFP